MAWPEGWEGWLRLGGWGEGRAIFGRLCWFGGVERGLVAGAVEAGGCAAAAAGVLQGLSDVRMLRS